MASLTVFLSGSGRDWELGSSRVCNFPEGGGPAHLQTHVLLPLTGLPVPSPLWSARLRRHRQAGAQRRAVFGNGRRAVVPWHPDTRNAAQAAPLPCSCDALTLTQTR